MTKELIDLRQSMLESRYDDALEIIDDLEEMSKQGTLRKIEAFLVRLVIHHSLSQGESAIRQELALKLYEQNIFTFIFCVISGKLCLLDIFL